VGQLYSNNSGFASAITLLANNDTFWYYIFRKKPGAYPAIGAQYTTEDGAGPKSGFMTNQEGFE